MKWKHFLISTTHPYVWMKTPWNWPMCWTTQKSFFFLREIEMFLFFILQIMTFKSSHLDFEFTINLCLFSLVSPPPFSSSAHLDISRRIKMNWTELNQCTLGGDVVDVGQMDGSTIEKVVKNIVAALWSKNVFQVNHLVFCWAKDHIFYLYLWVYFYDNGGLS